MHVRKPSLSGGVDEEQAEVEVSDLIVSMLERIGVEYVFGIPGGAVEPMYNAMARSERRGGLRHVLARHEAGAAFMADGYARETGKLGVCIATSGPGATNLITGIACSFDNGVPVLAITGQPPLPSFGKRAFQESACTGINTLGMFRHCTRYNSLVSHPDQVEHKLVSAMAKALRAPNGPTHLTFPVDVMRAMVMPQVSSYELTTLFRRRSLIDDGAIRHLCEEIVEARNIVFLIGGGCHEAVGPLMTLVNRLGAVFVATPDGKGLINPRHSAYRGVFGFAGHKTAEATLRIDTDLVIALGTNLGEWTSGGWSETVLNTRLIHVDASEDNLMRSPMARLHVRGRIVSVCERLLELLAFVQRPQRVDPLPSIEATLNDPDKYVSNEGLVKPQRLMQELSNKFPPTTRFVADTGNSTAWAVHYLHAQDRRLLSQDRRSVSRHHVRDERGVERRSSNSSWLRVTMDFAPMGWAIGAAIGIARANPSCPVVCITGDGSYLMNGQEITAATEEGLTVIYVVLNDESLGMVKHGQRMTGAEQTACALPPVDYRKLAEALNVPGYRIETPADFDQIDYAAILARKGPTMIDVRIDGEEPPPMGVRVKTLTGGQDE
ncbi:thiamine pyrophosphate-binding protein [Parachitinimonas caeni]|uniref:Thiamine pyrophosphate-binding protein n=1 Tax=Parachitinimonas caeni TaxID=3031301 RepID=A0ABT7E608_9NEIS|nr:thiamine pyrophosphate-binding protein [Parachitinimonas caeni]MDK2126895.1 thiamine pyrophosphate-binding protein [Parachitinimonas caeni]